MHGNPQGLGALGSWGPELSISHPELELWTPTSEVDHNRTNHLVVMFFSLKQERIRCARKAKDTLTKPQC